MGGVRASAPVGQAAVESIRAGADLCLICHREEFVTEAYEALIKTAEHDKKFDRRVEESARRVRAFKKKWAKTLRRAEVSPAAAVEQLRRNLWEFEEQVRLEEL